jgi:hypothetical protein
MNPLTYYEQFPKQQRKTIIAQNILSYWESHRENLELSRHKDHPFYRDAIRDLVEGTRLSQAFLDSPYSEKQPFNVLGAATRLSMMNYEQSSIKQRWNKGVTVSA